MDLSLGPMPTALREVVSRWIAGRPSHPGALLCDQDAIFITGGPGGSCYLDAEGEIWTLYACDDLVTWEDVATRLEDGPEKVVVVAYTASYRPELALWLPRRPAEAADCPWCEGGGLLRPPLPRIACPECSGLGWLMPLGTS